MVFIDSDPLKRTHVLITSLVAFAALSCDAPRSRSPSPIVVALGMRAAQPFKAQPPEALTMREMRELVGSAERRVPRRTRSVEVRADFDSAAPAAAVPAENEPTLRRLELIAPDLVVARGDSTPLRVALVDQAGAVHRLPADVTWQSLDPKLLSVADGVALGLRGGLATVVVRAAGLATTVLVEVTPAHRTRVLDLDGKAIVGVPVGLRTSAGRSTLVTDASGMIVVHGAPAVRESMRVDIGASSTIPANGASLELQSHEIDRTTTVVLLPTVWRIRGGRLHGTEIALDPRSAAPGGRYSFSRTAGAQVVGWPRQQLPLRIATPATLTAADTAAFWAIARDIEAEVGLSLFVPTTPSDSARMRIDGGLGFEGLTETTWTGSGELFGVEIIFRDAALLRNRRVVAHELLHALGIGHTVSWRSLMTPGATTIPWLTPHDVAWLQVTLALRGVQGREPNVHSLTVSVPSRDVILSAAKDPARPR